LKKLISQGKINETIDLLNQKLPKFLTTKQKSNSFLYYQLFIEYVKNNDIFTAIEIAQNHFIDFKDACVRFLFVSQFLIQDVLGLLAYESPLNSPLAHLLNQDQRNLTADIINQEIIGNFMLNFLIS
jgi:hypothetical protein